MTKNLKRMTIVLSIAFLVFSLFGCSKKGIPNIPNPTKVTNNTLENYNKQISSKNDKSQNLDKPAPLTKDIKKSIETKKASKTNKNINSIDLTTKTIVKVENTSTISTKIKPYVKLGVKSQVKPEIKPNVNPVVKPEVEPGVVVPEKPSTTDLGVLKVHYIDVGQADSILVEENKHFMLIDAGNNDDYKLVIDYLKKQGVKKLDYVIGTHPHEDHIGGLDKVIDNFDIETLLMSSKITNTKTFKDVLNSAKKKNLKITQPIVGENYNLVKATFTILAPKNKEYKSTNNYSIVQKLRFGNTSFIFTGDAESISEMEMVNANLDLQADVLKVGHHGSKTSTCQTFLDKVNPKYAVISCGKDNKYHHPNQSTMNRLKAKNIKVYRTDESGTVVATSNGKDIKFNCEEGSYNFRDHSTISISDKTIPSVVKDKTHTKIIDKKPTIKPHKPHKQTTDTSKKNKIYYTPNGECYHISKKCYTLRRSKKIITGTVKTCDSRRPCSKCSKEKSYCI